MNHSATKNEAADQNSGALNNGLTGSRNGVTADGMPVKRPVTMPWSTYSVAQSAAISVEVFVARFLDTGR
jgi:hypothetical protein